METTLDNRKAIENPPGGILMWIIIYLELFTFGIASIIMVVYANDELSVFHSSRLLLNSKLGLLNTVILLCSGFFVKTAVVLFQERKMDACRNYLKLTMLFGCLFVCVKMYEYMDKVQHGLLFDKNLFFTFYWMLTIFHLVHILIGLVILMTVHFQIRRKSKDCSDEFVEAAATFWHLCDLIWLILFPLLYLLF